MNRFICMDDMATNLGSVDRTRHEGERHRGYIPKFLFKLTEINALPIQSRRRPRLETPPDEIQPFERLAKMMRCRLTPATGRVLIRSDMDEAVQKCPGCHNKRAAAIPCPVFEFDAGHAPSFDKHLANPPNNPTNKRLLLEPCTHPLAVLLFIRLRSRRPDRRPTTSVQ